MNFALTAPFAFLRRPGARPLAAGDTHRAAAPAGAATALGKGLLVAVAQAQGATVECLRGSLWITHDYDPKDIVISAGESYHATRSARMVVFALEDSSVAIG